MMHKALLAVGVLLLAGCSTTARYEQKTEEKEMRAEVSTGWGAPRVVIQQVPAGFTRLSIDSDGTIRGWDGSQWVVCGRDERVIDRAPVAEPAATTEQEGGSDDARALDEFNWPTIRWAGALLFVAGAVVLVLVGCSCITDGEI